MRSWNGYGRKSGRTVSWICSCPRRHSGCRLNLACKLWPVWGKVCVQRESYSSSRKPCEAGMSPIQLQRGFWQLTRLKIKSARGTAVCFQTIQISDLQFGQVRKQFGVCDVGCIGALLVLRSDYCRKLTRPTRRLYPGSILAAFAAENSQNSGFLVMSSCP